MLTIRDGKSVINTQVEVDGHTVALQLLGTLVVVRGETMVHFFESHCVGIGDACASGLHEI